MQDASEGGCKATLRRDHRIVERFWEGRPERVKAPYTKFDRASLLAHLSTAGHVKPCRNLGGPPSKAKYEVATDSEQVP